jgi:hypothetical protein
MIKVPHANIPDCEVIYISEGESLEELDSDVLSNIDPASRAFFKNKDAKMEQLLSTIELESARKWYEGLLHRKCALAVLLNGKADHEEDRGGSYLLFQTDKESFLNNKEWPHSGPVLDVEMKMYNPKDYPAELLNIIKFGCPHFSYWYGGAQLVKAGEDNLVANHEWIGEFLGRIEEPDFDLRTLRFFYQDYCGSHLLGISDYFNDSRREIPVEEDVHKISKEFVVINPTLS